MSDRALLDWEVLTDARRSDVLDVLVLNSSYTYKHTYIYIYIYIHIYIHILPRWSSHGRQNALCIIQCFLLSAVE